ncbi:replication factor C subunit 3 [Ascoidea rubescens DSM 1968]|uniref:p-loop containing nucleoside triphosphate hydrolase protein n=1 Tax=Ascoidea rubescens DSM 1968 TaxID=1344418 RepID=A0A1D2VA43_9ASCO|nr:P-loop containing nucleoside triphosphate hydrolase protein [Ascoidea rubescens DSM 1968]ODV58293.1 P-loop containing nucleoside triphosphate hydrolase protein [Ascoidea rubescens DSM 1968]
MSDNNNKGTKENLPWVEKYRPSSLDEVYGQSSIISTLEKFVETGKLPHLLFYGPPGTGKTSTVLALAKRIYGEKLYKNMILELNASDDRGIDVVRDKIKNFASTMHIFSKGFKLVILDEADAMTNVAQNALRRIIEKYTRNTRFVILANYAHKLNPALLSRCTRFRFQPLSNESIKERMQVVKKEEKIRLAEDAELSLLKLSNGDMRKALNVLQSCKAILDFDDSDQDNGQEISLEMVYECIGAPNPNDIETILNSILRDDWTTSYLTLRKISSDKGLALIDLLEGFIEILDKFELKSEARIEILTGLSEIEYNISKGGNENIQSSATIAVIKNGMEIQGKS